MNAATTPLTTIERAELSASVSDARTRTLSLVTDLTDDQWMGPRLPIVNPIRWELGHVAWFAEHWVLRHAAGRAPISADADGLFDSSAVPHDTRWDLPLLDRVATLRYLEDIFNRVLARIDAPSFTRRDEYFVRLAVFHEDMHGEALVITRQTLGYPRPSGIGGRTHVPHADRAASGDARVPGGTIRLGAEPPTPGAPEPFVFDNEKWAHDIEVRPFAVARDLVTQGEFASFVDDGGYRRRTNWGDAGWAWLQAAGADAPVYWRREGASWLRREFDRWVPLEADRAVVHVNAFEAEAFCRWARRRLPAEAEWEVAASGPFACRQLNDTVWQWTSSPLAPYPGFAPDPYREYSEPWFHTHRVLRGGCRWTQRRLLRPTWRNFYTPDRRDVCAGIRTCALG